jgi:hypothetical protein
MDGAGSSFDPEGGAWTVGSLWHDIAGRQLGDELLEWAPDLFAFTDVVPDRSEAYRFAVSPLVRLGRGRRDQAPRTRRRRRRGRRP